jgi:hypothetical protein
MYVVSPGDERQQPGLSWFAQEATIIVFVDSAGSAGSSLSMYDDDCFLPKVNKISDFPASGCFVVKNKNASDSDTCNPVKAQGLAGRKNYNPERPNPTYSTKHNSDNDQEAVAAAQCLNFCIALHLSSQPRASGRRRCGSYLRLTTYVTALQYLDLILQLFVPCFNPSDPMSKDSRVQKQTGKMRPSVALEYHLAQARQQRTYAYVCVCLVESAKAWTTRPGKYKSKKKRNRGTPLPTPGSHRHVP